MKGSGADNGRHGIENQSLATSGRPVRDSLVGVARSTHGICCSLVSTLAVLLCACIPSSGSSQQLAVVNYIADKGPAHPQVWSMYQDSRGFLWIGTSEGLSRWDGEGFSNFSSPDGMHDLTIRCILEDDAGTLWLGTNDGAVQFDGRRFTSFVGDQAPGKGTIWSAAKDAEGHVWFGSQSGGVAVWTGSGFRSFGVAEGLASDYVYALFADQSNQLWMGHRGEGLTQCELGAGPKLENCRSLSTNDGLAHGEVRAITQDRWGQIWIGTRGGGVSCWDGESFRTYRVADGLASDDVYALLADHQDQLVIGNVRHGVTICDLPQLERCRSYGIANGLADDGVLSLLEDHDQSLWIGLSNGLSQLWSEHVESYTLRGGLPHYTVYSLLVDADSVVWVGTLDGVARVERPGGTRGPARIQRWKSEGTLPGYEVWSIARDRFGRLWIATERGMCLFADGRCRQVLTAAEGLAETDLIVLRPASDESLWVGTINGASQLRFKSPNSLPEVFNLTPDDGLQGSFVNSITEDAQGVIWLGTDRGLSRWDGETLRNFGERDGLPVAEILPLVASDDGGLWFGTNGGGLVRADPDGLGGMKFQVMAEDEGIPEVVSAIIRGSGDDLWVGTGDGVLRLRVAPGTHQISIVERLDRHSGLTGNEVNSLATAPGGGLWIGTWGGLTRVDPRRRERRIKSPDVMIERIQSLTGEVWRSEFSAPALDRDPAVHVLAVDPIHFKHDFAALRVDFRAPSMTPYATRYQSWLEGFDQSWSQPFFSSLKEYTNLDPGPYRLKLRAAVGEGEWGATTTLDFRVIPAWWQTVWFRVGGILLLGFLVTVGVTVRTSRIRRRAAELERAVDERTDDLRRYALALEDHSLALDRANIRIRHADKVKSEFLANMSHELRTPLNSIIGFSEVLDRKLEQRVDDRELRFLRNISRSGRYLLLLINNLLDLSKIEADRMTVNLDLVALRPLVEDTMRVVQGYAGDRSVNIVLNVEKAPPTVRVDVAKLNQILINLLSNAVKFSAKGDDVEVAIASCPKEDSPLATESYRITVTDHGSGISPEDQEVVFQAFRQAPRSAHPGGTGLGLALVQRYVQMLCGEISLRSKVDVGTTFEVVLPCQPQPELAPDRELSLAPTAEDQSFGSPCVLVIDHDRQHFAPLARSLEEHGMLPVRAGDSVEAQRMAEGLRPAALVTQCADDHEREWAAFLEMVTPPLFLPVVFASSTQVSHSILVAADVCLVNTAASTAIVEIAQRLSSQMAPSAVLIGLSRERGLELAEAGIVICEQGAAAEAAVAIIDLDWLRPREGIAHDLQLTAEMPRILLLPEQSPRHFEHSGIHRLTGFEDLSSELHSLLRRRRRYTANNPAHSAP